MFRRLYAVCGNVGRYAVMTNKQLPIGIEDFSKLKSRNYYYVDKTLFLKDLLDNLGEVSLFSRPRRFGKTLTLNMIKRFFGVGEDPTLFAGLNIEREREFCEKYQNKYPVISVTLKGVDSSSYEMCRRMLASEIQKDALRHDELAGNPALNELDLQTYKALLAEPGKWTEDVITTSLSTLCRLLTKVYGRKTILLIDEYDVPLQKAWLHGELLYKQVVQLVRNLFSDALKTNEYLEFAVITGCLRVSKESIFTGLNNVNVYSTTDTAMDEYFGFTDREVRQMLSDYDASILYDTTKEWYDGYLFGKENVFCPWDMIKWCFKIRSVLNDAEPGSSADSLLLKGCYPECFWANSSGNDIVHELLVNASEGDRSRISDELNTLICGGTVKKVINQTLTYNEMTQSIDSIWSTLFLTGYLTPASEVNGEEIELRIPNLEVKKIYTDTIRNWLKAEPGRQSDKVAAIIRAMGDGNADELQYQLSLYLSGMIGVRDFMTRKDLRENFYHGIMAGLLSGSGEWQVRSNEEAGRGYSDILLRNADTRTGIVLEFKYSDKKEKLEADAQKALNQIDEMDYSRPLCEDGMRTILKYGISFWQARCCVVLN